MSTEQKGRRRSPAAHERQRDPERTKARIVEAAIVEFSAKGYAGARVADIAARAGVNQQLIAYYFDGKEGLYREIGKRWRSYEAETFPDDMDFAELIRSYVRLSADPSSGGRLLAWEGLSDDGSDSSSDEEVEERNARLRHEVEVMRARQAAGEIDPELDPAALVLISMSAAGALTVYPQLARGLLGGDGRSAEVVEHFANQLAEVFTRLKPRKP